MPFSVSIAVDGLHYLTEQFVKSEDFVTHYQTSATDYCYIGAREWFYASTWLFAS